MWHPERNDDGRRAGANSETDATDILCQLVRCYTTRDRNSGQLLLAARNGILSIILRQVSAATRWTWAGSRRLSILFR